jgi:hypothetical protein
MLRPVPAGAIRWLVASGCSPRARMSQVVHRGQRPWFVSEMLHSAAQADACGRRSLRVAVYSLYGLPRLLPAGAARALSGGTERMVQYRAAPRIESYSRLS